MKYIIILVLILIPVHSQANLLETPNAKNYTHSFKKYPFRFSPVSAQQIINKLKKTTQVPLAISAVEKPLLQDILDGQFDSFSIEEAVIIASGITDKNLARKYVNKLESIYRSIRKHLSRQSSEKNKARYLLLYLHKYHLKHYDIASSNLIALLDRGIYNCVSSSLLYNIMAKKLGLNVRGVEAPEHCFSIVYNKEEDPWDIETTSPAGFDAAHTKNLSQVQVHTNGYVVNKTLRREMTVDKQVAMIYYNRGVALAKKKKYIASTVEYFKALLIDNNFYTACQNTIVNFAYYSRKLNKAGKIDRALQMLYLGLELAPNDKNLLNDLNVLFRNSAIDLIQKKKYDTATKLLTKARTYFPKEEDFAFLIASAQLQEALNHKQNFTYAMQLLDKTIKESPFQIREEVYNSRWYVIDEHAQYQASKRQWQKAIAIYEWGLKLKGGETLRNNWVKTYVDWGEFTQATDQVKAIVIYEEALQKSPQQKHFQSRLMLLYQQIYSSELQKKQYKRAFSWMSRLYSSFPQQQAVKNNLWYVYQQWHKHLLETKQYKKAHNIFQSVQKQFPKENKIRSIYTAISNEVAMNYAQKNSYSHALAIYSGLRKNLPEDRQIQNNFHYLLQEGIKSFIQQKKYKQLSKLIALLRKKLPNEPLIIKIASAQLMRQAQNNQDPLEIYTIAKCLRYLPSQQNTSDSIMMEALRVCYAQKDDAALWKIYTQITQNFSATEQVAAYMHKLCTNRGIQLINEKNWYKAINFCKRAVRTFPRDTQFQRRLDYALDARR
ncbi:tetratricopeptide repeat protein [Candidatus Uabimicrobium sp. HlEnr_7]|uniref:tetratricopeptide repeat protein n=1 Tax=Candidatus Uabimicrobium helgolandensis TaxID=3095367 RepID=UPI003556CA87